MSHNESAYTVGKYALCNMYIFINGHLSVFSGKK